MAAPSEPFVTPPLSELDPGDAIKAEHMVDTRGSLINVDEQVSFGFTREQAHNHDLVNSAGVDLSVATGQITQAQIALFAIGQGNLKTAIEVISVALPSGAGTDVNATFSAVGEFGFYPKTRSASTGRAFSNSVGGHLSLTDVTQMHVHVFSAGGGGGAFSTIRYITTTGPYFLGGLDWGNNPWCYVLLDDVGDLVRCWLAGDPTWHLRYRTVLPKNSPVSIVRRPHPFVDDVVHFDPVTGLPASAAGVIPAGWDLKLIDLRGWDTDVDNFPEANRQAEIVGASAELTAAGCTQDECDGLEATQQVFTDAEATATSAARSSLTTLDQEMDDRIARIQFDEGAAGTPEAQIDIWVARVDELRELERGRLRRLAGYRTRFEAVQDGLRRRGASVVGMVTGDDTPLIDEETLLRDAITLATLDLVQADIDLLPSVTPFTDAVRVLRAP